jgi:hypothetical protein
MAKVADAFGVVEPEIAEVCFNVELGGGDPPPPLGALLTVSE